MSVYVHESVTFPYYCSIICGGAFVKPCIDLHKCAVFNGVLLFMTDVLLTLKIVRRLLYDRDVCQRWIIFENLYFPFLEREYVQIP